MSKKLSRGWAINTLQEIAPIVDCKHRTPQYSDEGIPIISPGDIREGALTFETCKKVSEEEYLSLMDHCEVKIGDIVFGRNQSVGIAAYIISEEPFALGQDTVLIQPNNIVSGYVYYYLQSPDVRTQIKKVQGGSTFGRINLKDLRELKITYPSFPEQERIAAILSTWDEAIAKTQALISRKERLANVLINQLVMNADHLQEYRVEDLFRLGRGRVINKGEIEQNPGPYPVYSSQSRNNGEFGKIATCDFEGEYITWTTDGANAGTVFYRNGKFNCTNVCGTAKLLPKNQADLRFIAHYLQKVAKQYVSYVGNPKLMNGVFAAITFSLPEYSHQVWASNVIEAVLEEASLLSKQLEIMKTQKQGLMQKLLSGQWSVAPAPQPQLQEVAG